ncbi:MAG TPA: alpha/beta hydrolase [Tepidisphaeraceae bacterium]|jgi:acetyl esterase/lipase|nr:alpha/beta hydrolase [Tepidisphaeraceae bacterium]
MRRQGKAFACLLLLFASVAAAAEAPEYQRTEDVIYGRKFGTALTLDVFRPAHVNGKGVIFIVSGGWFSGHEAINGAMYAPMLGHGYTVFAVVHGSQPKFTITEIVPDIHRAVRFIRHNAKKFEVDPGDLGLMGASAGGHLTLTMATQGGPGPAKSKDPVDAESSAVQAAVAFFPPTDFLNYGEPGEDAVGVGVLKAFKPAFGPEADTAEGRQKLGKQISPIYFVHAGMPPILIIHGDADKLVPIQQAKSFVAKCEEVNSPVKLIVKPGLGHGWPKIDVDLQTATDWLDAQLLSKADSGR